MAQPRVVSVNVSAGGIPKLPVNLGYIVPEGLQGDDHNHEKHRTPLQAISIIDLEDLQDLKQEGFAVGPGATGENLTVRDLNVDDLKVGDRLTIGGESGAELELTKIRKPCFVLDEIDPQLKVAIAGRCGFLARVLRAGEVRPGDAIEVACRGEPS